MKNTELYDSDLNPILAMASNADLAPLVDYITNKLSENLTSSRAYIAHHPDHQQYADLIANEIREFGGNSLANALRLLFGGAYEGPSYHEIVCDVAEKLKANFNKQQTVADIEMAILEVILKKALERMPEEEKRALLRSVGYNRPLSLGCSSTAAFIAIFRAGGFKSYQITLMIANQIAKMILGKGLPLVVNASIARTTSVLMGPLGWAVTLMWSMIDLAGPSYKTTMPCVIHIAMLRQKLMANKCQQCGELLLDGTMKFCPQCGQAIAA